MAPPGIDDQQRADLIALLEDAHDSEEWAEALANNGWEDQFLAGDEFGTYIEEEQVRVREILIGIGLVDG